MTVPIRSGSMMLVASSGDPDRCKLPPLDTECKVIWRGWLQKSYECGHRDSRVFRVTTFGRETVKIRQNKQCPDCFLAEVKKHTIFCALCGLPIMPGEGVALYNDDNKGIRKEATHVGSSVLGCMRWDCCPSGGFFGGHWTMNGFKEAF